MWKPERRFAAVGLLALLAAAGASCDETIATDTSTAGSPSGTGGGGSSDASTTASVSSTTGASTSGTSTSGASTSGTSTSGTSTSGTSTGGASTPCMPLANGDDPSPTPGSCDGGVATTCGQDGFLVHDACEAGTECRTYTLHEKRFDDGDWIDAREITWAACLPTGAEACPVAWNGNNYLPTDKPHCDGAQKIVCLQVPAPDLFSNSPQLQHGADEGYLEIIACAPGSKCAGSNDLDVLTCIDEDTPACDGTEPSCSGNGIVYCGGTWESLPGYKYVSTCQGDEVCYEGTDWPFCAAAGAEPCAPDTAPACAADGQSIVSCYEGFTYHDSCATCFSNDEIVPCRCDITNSRSGWSWSPLDGLECHDGTRPMCVPSAASDCDPLTDADTCVGNVAHRCLGHWEDIDCTAVGKVCGVGDGFAGCRAAEAPACSHGESGSCSGTEFVGCCTCGQLPILNPPELDAPCVSGFEVRGDCADKGSYQCEIIGNSAVCEYGG